MQEVRKDLERKPIWIGEDVWAHLKEHWRSLSFKKKSEINKRNRESVNGASLHTDGSIPHRLHWKRMKQEKGMDPSLSEFYFRTHRKKDKSWVGHHAKLTFDKFQQRKFELSSQREDGVDSQSSINHPMPSDLDIWVDLAGKKNGRIPGLGSLGKMLTPSRFSTKYEDVCTLRGQIQELNESLQKQEEEKLAMMQELQRQEKDKLEIRQELNETKRHLVALMTHLGFVGSSSHPPPSLECSYGNVDNDDDDEDSDEEGHI
uniref:Uncharacterized protein n=1 Tax=Cajanus cajan TaxID=3821 RepID=A0A151TUJ7_CAJCA|nr:hypothetical protein KK1_009981 [Cajanus cajan]